MQNEEKPKRGKGRPPLGRHQSFMVRLTTRDQARLELVRRREKLTSKADAVRWLINKDAQGGEP